MLTKRQLQEMENKEVLSPHDAKLILATAMALRKEKRKWKDLAQVRGQAIERLKEVLNDPRLEKHSGV